MGAPARGGPRRRKVTPTKKGGTLYGKRRKGAGKGRNVRPQGRQIFAHRILFENPLLIALLGLYPVAAACHTLKNALELSVMLAVLIPPAAVLFCCVGGRIPLWAAPGRGIGLQRGAVPGPPPA